MTAQVNCEVALSIRVANFIAKYEGFSLATTSGEMIESYTDCNELGILWDDPNETPKRRFFGLLPGNKKQRKFIGVLWIENANRGVTRDKWFFEVYGKNEYEYIKKITNDLASYFNVKITLYLSKESALHESSYSIFFD